MITAERFLENICEDNLSGDPDHTKKAREFYERFFGETLSNSVLDYDGGLGHYRGETIISFNTVAGCMIRLLEAYNGKFTMPKSQEERLAVITGANDVIDSMKDKFRQFYDLYHTLANFMPLPMGTVNINSVKGGAPYRDFPDLFLADLHMCQPEQIFYDRINADYFKRFGSWKRFVEKNYLQDFFTDTSYSKYVPLAPVNIKMPYSKAISKEISDDGKHACKVYIENFLIDATNIIKKRAQRLAREESTMPAADNQNSRFNWH